MYWTFSHPIRFVEILRTRTRSYNNFNKTFLFTFKKSLENTRCFFSIICNRRLTPFQIVDIIMTNTHGKKISKKPRFWPVFLNSGSQTIYAYLEYRQKPRLLLTAPRCSYGKPRFFQKIVPWVDSLNYNFLSWILQDTVFDQLHGSRIEYWVCVQTNFKSQNCPVLLLF
jgi:hypothetical protein